MNCVESIRKTFAEWPEDVLEQWLLPNCEREGFDWPPREPFSRSIWNRVMLGRPVDWLEQLNWELKSIPLNLDCFSNVDQFLLGKLIGAQKSHQNRSGFGVKNSADRFENIARYVAQKGELPRPPVFIEQQDGFRIADGYHRVATFLNLQQDREIERLNPSARHLKSVQTFWLGVHQVS